MTKLLSIDPEVLKDRPADLFVSFVGDHDEIKAVLRSGKYR